MSKKLTYEFVKESFEKEGYKLLSGGCVNSRQKLDYICPKGHGHSISWDNWNRGRRCPYCAGLVKKSIEFIRSEFKKEGYILLTKVYKNAFQKLYYICPNDHQHSITWNNWQQGKRCPYCVGVDKKTIKFIRSEFEKERYQLLTKEYKNNEQKLDYICPNGHKYNISWGSWTSGHRCSYCSTVKNSCTRRLDFDFIKSSFEKAGYSLLTIKYINCNQKLDYICPNGHKHSITWDKFRVGNRCPYCVGKISKGEIEVRNSCQL